MFTENATGASVSYMSDKCIRDSDALGGYNPAGCTVNAIEWQPKSTA